MPGAFRSNPQADAPAIRRLRKTSVCDAAACWLGRVRCRSDLRRKLPHVGLNCPASHAAPSVTCGALQRLIRDRPFGAPRTTLHHRPDRCSPPGMPSRRRQARPAPLLRFRPLRHMPATTRCPGRAIDRTIPLRRRFALAVLRLPRVMRRVFRQVSRRSATPRTSCVAWPESKAHRTCRFSPAAPLGFTLRSFLPPGRACGTFPSFVSHLPFYLQPSPRSFSPGISRCETFFYASLRLANLSPTANGQSRTLSIGFWEFSRRAIRFSRQPPTSGCDAALGFHAPAA